MTIGVALLGCELSFRNDEVKIDLQNIPDPAPGKSYYAWLEPDKGMNMAAPILPGTLSVHQGQVHYLYPGGQLQEGVVQVHCDIQRLATFDIQPYRL